MEKKQLTKYNPGDYEGYEIIRPYDDSKINEHAARCGGQRNLREIPVTSEDECFVYLVKKPSMAVIQAIAEEEEKKGKTPKAITNIQNLMLGCVLEGDKDAYTHDGAIYSQLLASIGALVHEAKSSIKKI